MNTQKLPVTSRRQVIVGGASLIAMSGINGPAVALTPWMSAVTAGVAAGWIVEALKAWGFVPQTRASTSVASSHERESGLLRHEGYSVRPVYSGAYSGGDFELSEARQAEDFVALSTTNHGSNVCTLKFDPADALNLGLVASALRRKGFDARSVEASTFPVHPPEVRRMVGSRRYSPTYMTPSHGTIAWSTDMYGSRPNLATSIRSPLVNANIRFAQLDNGRWTFDMT